MKTSGESEEEEEEVTEEIVMEEEEEQEQEEADLLNKVQSRLKELQHAPLDVSEDCERELAIWASQKINVLQNESVHKELLSLLFTSGHSSSYKANMRKASSSSKITAPVLAAKMLWSLHSPHTKWCLDFLGAYLDDSLECRQWVDSNDLQAKKFCENILAWVSADDVKYSSDSEGKIHLMESADVYCTETEDLVDRFYSDGGHQKALQMVVSTFQSKIASKGATGGMVPIIKAVQTFSALPAVRLLAAKNMLHWLGNPALIEHVGRLLTSVVSHVQTTIPVQYLSLPMCRSMRDYNLENHHLLASDIETIILICSLRHLLKQSLLEQYRQALAKLMSRNITFGELDSCCTQTTAVQQVIVRFHLEECHQTETVSLSQSSQNPSEAIKMLSYLLLAIPSQEHFSCKCLGVTSTSETTSFQKHHRGASSFVLGSAIGSILFPLPSKDEKMWGGFEKIWRNLETGGLSIASFCPESFWKPILYAKDRIKVPNSCVLSFLAELSAAISVIYSHDIAESQKKISKRLDSSKDNREVKPETVSHSSSLVRGNAGGGRGGRGTPGLTLSTKQRTAGRGSGVSLSGMRGDKTKISAAKSAVSSESRARTSVVSNDATSCDDKLQPLLSRADADALSQRQSDFLLQRSSSGQKVLLEWFSRYLVSLLQNVGEGYMVRKKAAQNSQNGVETSARDRLCAVSAGKDSARGRGYSVSSQEAVDATEDLATPYSSELIDFVQKVLLVHPQNTVVSNSLDKSTLQLALQSRVLCGDIILALIEIVGYVSALEQKLFRAQATKDQSSSEFVKNALGMDEAVPCSLSFVHSCSANELAEQNLMNLDLKCLQKPYDCSLLLESGFDLIESQILRALGTVYCKGEKIPENKNVTQSSGLVVDSTEFIRPLFALCKLPIVDNSHICNIGGRDDVFHDHDSVFNSDLDACVQLQLSASSSVADCIKLKNCVGYAPLYWHACLLCYLIGCSCPAEVGSFLWDNISSVQLFMLMSITERFHFHPAFPQQECILAHARFHGHHLDKQAQKSSNRRRGKRRKSRDADGTEMVEGFVDNIANSGGGFASLTLSLLDGGSRAEAVCSNNGDHGSAPVILLNAQNTLANVTAIKYSSSAVQTAINTLQMSKHIQLTDMQTWRALFTPLPLTNYLKDEKDAVNGEEELVNSKGNEEEVHENHDNRAAGDSVSNEDKEACQTNDDAVGDGSKSSFVPRRSGRKRVSRFNIASLAENDSSDDSVCFKDEAETKHADEMLIHTSLWGRPKPTDIILLSVQSISREPPSCPNVSCVESQDPNTLSVIDKVKEWHEKYMFGKILRDSTSPDFIAAVVTGKDDQKSLAYANSVVEANTDKRSTSRNRQYIMESIGWLVPAITASPRNQSTTSVEAILNVLRRIPPVATLHLLLVITLKILHSVERDGGRLLHLNNCLDDDWQGWSQEQEMKIEKLFRSGSSSCIAPAADIVQEILSAGRKDDRDVTVKAEIVLDFVSSKGFCQDSMLYDALLTRVASAVWPNEYSLNNDLIVMLDECLKGHNGHNFESAPISTAQTSRRDNSCIQGTMLFSLLTELWHPIRSRRLASRIVLVGLSTRNDNVVMQRSPYDCLLSLFAVDASGCQLFQQVLDNMVAVETDPSVVHDILAFARERFSEGFSAIVCSTFKLAHKNEFYLTFFKGSNSPHGANMSPRNEFINSILKDIAETISNSDDFDDLIVHNLKGNDASISDEYILIPRESGEYASDVSVHCSYFYVSGMVLAHMVNSYSPWKSVMTVHEFFSLSHPLSEVFKTHLLCLNAIPLDNNSLARCVETLFLEWGKLQLRSSQFYASVVDMFPSSVLCSAFKNWLVNCWSSDGTWQKELSPLFLKEVVCRVDSVLDWSDKQIKKAMQNVFSALLELEEAHYMESCPPMRSTCPVLSQLFVLDGEVIDSGRVENSDMASAMADKESDNKINASSGFLFSSCLVPLQNICGLVTSLVLQARRYKDGELNMTNVKQTCSELWKEIYDDAKDVLRVELHHVWLLLFDGTVEADESDLLMLCCDFICNSAPHRKCIFSADLNTFPFEKEVLGIYRHIIDEAFSRSIQFNMDAKLAQIQQGIICFLHQGYFTSMSAQSSSTCSLSMDSLLPLFSHYEDITALLMSRSRIETLGSTLRNMWVKFSAMLLSVSSEWLVLASIKQNQSNLHEMNHRNSGAMTKAIVCFLNFLGLLESNGLIVSEETSSHRRGNCQVLSLGLDASGSCPGNAILSGMNHCSCSGGTYQHHDHCDFCHSQHQLKTLQSRWSGLKNTTWASWPDVLLRHIAAESELAMEIVSSCIHYALDLNGVDRSNHAFSRNFVLGNARSEKPKPRGRPRASRVQQRGDCAESAAPGQGRKLIRMAIISSYLSHPDRVLSLLPAWTRNQVKLREDESAQSSVLPPTWITANVSGKDSSGGAKKRKPVRRSARRPKRGRPRAGGEAVEEDAPSDHEDVEYTVDSTEKSSPSSYCDAVCDDLTTLFHLLVAAHLKASSGACHDDSDNSSSKNATETENETHPTSLYAFDGPRCALDEMVVSCLVAMRGVHQEERSTATQLTPCGLMRLRAAACLRDVASSHPALWLLRYCPKIPSLLAPVVQLLALSDCRLELSKLNALEESLHSLIDANEICCGRWPLVTFIASIESEVSSPVYSINPAVRYFELIAEKLCSSENHETVPGNDITQECKSKIQESIAVFVQKFTENQILRTIVKEKLYTRYSKLLSRSGMYLTGLSDM